MFAAFLSPDMTYSCPIWLPKSNPNSATETLEAAQNTKLQRFIDNAHIKSTDHVLEVGTGWGSFAIAAVRQTGCRVTSLTLSTEQKELAEKRIAEAGFTDNIEVLLCDYRALPTPKEGLYDKVISIEMLEAVGREYLTIYFECIDRLLKPEGGIAVFQCITMPETVGFEPPSYLPFERKLTYHSATRPTTNRPTSFGSTSSQAGIFPPYHSSCRPSTPGHRTNSSLTRSSTSDRTTRERCACGARTS